VALSLTQATVELQQYDIPDLRAIFISGHDTVCKLERVRLTRTPSRRLRLSDRRQRLGVYGLGRAGGRTNEPGQ
jgi:hypothetical protein